MTVRIPARVHFWPWSCATGEETRNLSDGEVTFPYYGSPIISLAESAQIFLPARHERFHPLGPSFLPPSSPERCRLFESPHGADADVSNNAGLAIHSTINGDNVRQRVLLSPKGVKPRWERCDEQGASRDSDLYRTVLAWSSRFDELLDKAHAMSRSNELLEWTRVKAYLKELAEATQEPSRAIIVDIAETMHRPLPETVRAARRVLLRERRLLPAGRVEETDSACLHWYIRQQGRTLAEKAGSRQRLLAVARQETYNLHENRILKDFLHRCTAEAKRYIANARSENPAFENSERTGRVRSLSSLCTQLAMAPHLEEVDAPHPSTPPNYVLLHDMRYRQVWRWYQRLLRQEREKDRFWDWQSRTWADIARLLVSVAIILHMEELDGSNSLRLSTLYEGALQVRGEQILGSRAAAGCETGPLLIERRNRGEGPPRRAVLEIVHPENAKDHPVARHLGFTGGQLYLVLRPVEQKVPPRVLIVWAVHTAASTKIPSWEKIAASAAKALDGHQTLLDMARLEQPPMLRGLVLCSHFEPKASSEVNREKLRLITVPMMPAGWMDGTETIMLSLHYMLEKMLA
ncbi:MAG: DUF2357 domain-containing protein [Thermodesulfobacteriota bacterium]